MWRSSGPASSLLLSCAVSLCCWHSLHGRGLSKISPPVNLSVTSYDFHTVLKWDVVDTSRNSWFNVEIKNYSISHWRPFLPCLNVSTHHCDLSDGFVPDDDTLGYYARVNMVTESQKSDFVSTNRFIFKLNATLGPPDVKLRADNNHIIVEVNYTLPNSIVKRNAKILKTLLYNIWYWHPEKPKLVDSICNSKKTLHQIQIPTGVTCVSAEVYLQDLNLKGNRSQETCLQIHPINVSVLPFVISVVTILAIVIVIIATLFICHFAKKKQVLPKVLVHRIMGERGKAYMDVNMESDESKLSELKGLEDAITIPEVDQCDETQEDLTKPPSDIFVDQVNTDVNDSEPVNADLDDPYAAKIHINGIDQRCHNQDSVEVDDDVLEKTYDLCKTNSEPVKQICADNWGYDKPQVLFAL
ncbi:interferon gamma receptor 1-like isoform X2 [Stegostoma tigrinum]|uniref:interferon gamma receptor 1-like isoform X2 n=1 Tax=Stegostoma tigrinum TaxID=3053191 RepID=UPI00202ACBB7|nr:interferon gamma receptor 1-like isoform X2 [Stegostoma tigrinum]